MEQIDENIFEQVQIITRKKAKVGKPPTRLQRKAPASIEVSNNCNGVASSSPHTPIPLLSPLTVAPAPITHQPEEFRFPAVDVDMSKNDKGGGGGGWQHPAVANAYMDPSSLFTVFQSKCVLVNHGK